jgi:hyperosmotically inducible protein
LRGKAANDAQKELTADYARDVDGAKGVVNEMIVAGEPSHPGETFHEKVDDASVTAEVKATLMAHRSTSALNTHVETRDGIVTLTGIAKNAAQKDLVTRLVSDVDGVTSVVNDMTVDSTLSSN